MNRFHPSHRLRRLRGSEVLRDLVREVTLTPNDLIYPIFITAEEDGLKEISSMPGQYRIGLDKLEEQVRGFASQGIRSLLLFGIPKQKDAHGSDATREDGVIQEAIRLIKRTTPEIWCITDICLCEFTNHGHCGLVENGQLLNDDSLKLLAEMAVSHARAGADMVAPSAMLDYQIQAIRRALDENGFGSLPIMGYSAKMASSFYGPFREAAGSTPQFGNRRSYQMDGANRREALREIEADIEQGADLIMVKPGIAYLDVVRDARERYEYPIAVYNVSGEYSMVKAAAKNGWLDERATVMEMMTSFKRAGADLIITYFAPQVVSWLK